MKRKTAAVLVIALSLIGFAFRFVDARRQGLDIDEVFSLAIATGHSIEHPAAAARPELGDFVQATEPQPPSWYTRYVRHEPQGTSLHRVVRASFLSDTNPPLYYIALHYWTRLTGTGDLALRMFSILLSTLCIPLSYRVGRRMYGRNAGVLAAALTTFAPQAIFYGGMGRMYPLVAVLTLCAVLTTLTLRHRGASALRLGTWIVVSAAGLLTHYFFVFFWAAACLWLLLHPGRMRRLATVLAFGGALALAAPWYARIPASLENWRVTKGWLETVPHGFDPVLAQIRPVASFFLTSGDWLNRTDVIDYFIIALVTVVVVAGIVRSKRLLLAPRTQLLLLWLLASNIGLLVFDLLQGTFSRLHSRYAFAGLAAALILLAFLMSRLRPAHRIVAVTVLVSLWLVGFTRLEAVPRGGNPFRGIAGTINREGTGDRVIVVHAIPTGVIGLARYLDEDALMLDWVEALGTRSPPREAAAIAAAGKRVTLIRSPAKGDFPELDYLRAHAELLDSAAGTGYDRYDFDLANLR